MASKGDDLQRRGKDLQGQAKDVHDDVKDSDEVDTLQRVGRYGYVVYGVVHVVLGALAVSLALGGGDSEDASTTGAMQTLSDQPFGAVLIWSVAVGMAALVVWQLLEAALDPDDEGAKGRVKAAGKAVAYGVVAVGAFGVATSGGGGEEGGSTEESITQQLLALPLGQVLVGLVAVGILVVAGYHVHKGLSGKFFSDVETGDLPARARSVVKWSGLIGYPAKGVAFGAIGVLFGFAAVRGSSEEAGGMDEGLATLREGPFGTAVLVVVGLGFALFGVYCLARARSAGDLTGFAGR